MHRERKKNFVGKRVCSRLVLPEFSFYLYHLLTVGLWANNLNILRYNFLVMCFCGIESAPVPEDSMNE